MSELFPLTKKSVRTAALLFLGGGFVLYFALVRLIPSSAPRQSSNELATANISDIFSSEFPVSQDLITELHQLRQTGKLKPQNEARIEESIRNVAKLAKMPAPLLWCTTFQVSHFDHLLKSGPSNNLYGIGKFSDSDFYEFNHQLDRYAPTNVSLVLDALGRDIRPVRPDEKDLFSDWSYFSIPTSVVATATSLNSRFSELDGLLQQQNISARRDFLWVLASLAYQSGMRSVVAILEDAIIHSSTASLSRTLSEVPRFTTLIHDAPRIQQAFRRYWPLEIANRRADYFVSTARGLSNCAFSSPASISRVVAHEGWDRR